MPVGRRGHLGTRVVRAAEGPDLEDVIGDQRRADPEPDQGQQAEQQGLPTHVLMPPGGHFAFTLRARSSVNTGRASARSPPRWTTSSPATPLPVTGSTHSARYVPLGRTSISFRSAGRFSAGSGLVAPQRKSSFSSVRFSRLYFKSGPAKYSPLSPRPSPTPGDRRSFGITCFLIPFADHI